MSFKRDGDDQSWLNTLKRRRVSELFAVNIPEDEAYLMKNGRFACTVCHYRPVFDTINALAVHRSGRKHAANVDEFLSKKSELKHAHLKRQHEQYVSSGHLPVVQQQMKTVHKLLGARLYDSRAKRPKLKATDRRPTVDVTATSSDNFTDADLVKPPQTIDEIRRLQNRRSQDAQPVLKPYVGKQKTGVVQDKAVHEANKLAQDCISATEINLAASCDIVTSDSSIDSNTADTDVQPVKYHSDSHGSKVKTGTIPTNEPALSVDTNNCLPKEKVVQYLHAVGSGWKRSRDGSWVKDENAEFDSDEDAPDI